MSSHNYKNRIDGVLEDFKFEDIETPPKSKILPQRLVSTDTLADTPTDQLLRFKQNLNVITPSKFKSPAPNDEIKLKQPTLQQKWIEIQSKTESQENQKKKETQYTWKDKSTIVSLVFLNGMKEGFFLVLAPFFPEKMHEKNVAQVIFTPLFLQYTIFMFIASLAGGKIQGKFGRRIMVRISMVLQLIAAISFIFLNYVESTTTFLAIGFIGRAIQGTGAGLYQTAAYSELLIQFPNIQKKLVSTMEVGAVMGGFTALVISAFLAYAVGFVGPFAFCALVFLIYGLFQDKLITFVDSNTPLTNMQNDDESLLQQQTKSKRNQHFNMKNSFTSLNLERSYESYEMDSINTKMRKDSKKIYVENLESPEFRRQLLKHSPAKSKDQNSYDCFNKFDNQYMMNGHYSGEKNSDKIRKNSLKKSTQKESPRIQAYQEIQMKEQVYYDRLNYSHIFMTKRGFFACLTIIMNLQTFYYCDTILADHLKQQYNLNPSIISLIYAIQQVGFMTTAPITPNIVHRFSLVGVVITTQLIQSAAALLVGPSHILNLHETLTISILGFVISGLACPFSIIPPYSELEYCLSAHKDKKFHPEDVQDIVSGVFNSAYAMGSIGGPLFGGYVNEWVGFRKTNDIQSLLLLSVALLQLFVVYIPSKLEQRNKAKYSTPRSHKYGEVQLSNQKQQDNNHQNLRNSRKTSNFVKQNTKDLFDIDIDDEIALDSFPSNLKSNNRKTMRKIQTNNQNINYVSMYDNNDKDQQQRKL
eukprot:403364820